MTDNQAVTYLRTKKDLTWREARWIDLLADFHFSITHRPGRENLADSLSRRPDLEAFAIEGQGVLHSEEEHDIRSDYEADRQAQAIIGRLAKSQKENYHERYRWNDQEHRLFMKTDDRWRLYVPKGAWRLRLSKEHHDAGSAGLLSTGTSLFLAWNEYRCKEIRAFLWYMPESEVWKTESGLVSTAYGSWAAIATYKHGPHSWSSQDTKRLWLHLHLCWSFNQVCSSGSNHRNCWCCGGCPTLHQQRVQTAWSQPNCHMWSWSKIHGRVFQGCLSSFGNWDQVQHGKSPTNRWAVWESKQGCRWYS